MAETGNDEVEAGEVIDGDADAHSDNTTQAIGQRCTDFRIHASPVYSFQYFRRGEEVETAICLSCEEHNKKAATDKRLKIRQQIYKVKNGNTSALVKHLQNVHSNLIDQFNKQCKEVEDEKARLKVKIAESRKPKDGKLQTTLNAFGNVDYKIDADRQQRWDNAVVDVIVETGISFRSTESFDHLCKALWPSGTMKIKVRSHQTVARHIELRYEKLFTEFY